MPMTRFTALPFAALSHLEGAVQGYERHIMLLEAKCALPKVSRIDENGIYDHVMSLTRQDCHGFE
jgi:hypothetical protein